MAASRRRRPSARRRRSTADGPADLYGSQDPKTGSLRQRGLPAAVGHEALGLERDRGGDVQDVERPGTEYTCVLRAQLGGEIERTAPEHDREPSFPNVSLEIGDRRSGQAFVDVSSMDSQVNRIDEFGAAEPCDR